MHAAIAANRKPGQFTDVRILVLDDDEEVREATSALLEAEGMVVVACGAPEAALDVLRSEVPLDLLFSDIVLGASVSGYEVAAEALAMRPGLPVLLTTGYTGRFSGSAMGLPPDTPLLLKPFRRKDLLAAIDFALSSRTPPAQVPAQPSALAPAPAAGNGALPGPSAIVLPDRAVA